MPQINIYVSDAMDLQIKKAAEKREWTAAHYARWATAAALEREAKADAKKAVGK